MIGWLSKYFYQLQIRVLIIFRPTVLFDKINQLDWYKSTLHQWVEDQNFSEKNKVLEVGCATGKLASYIAESGCIVTGVDLSSEMIELAKIESNDIDYIVADAIDLPFESNCFDAVIATSLINIVDDKSKAMNELSRTCRKGGKISILVPSENFYDKDLLALQLTIGISGFSAAAMQAWHKNPPKMNTDDIRSLFLQAGLIEVTTKKYLQGMVVSATAIKPF